MLLPSLQNAIVSFKELCGLSAVANLKRCILALRPRLMAPDNSPLLLFSLRDQYPYLEPQGLLPDLLKKVVATYDLVSARRRDETESLETFGPRKSSFVDIWPPCFTAFGSKPHSCRCL